jgi:hypothetical protein
MRLPQRVVVPSPMRRHSIGVGVSTGCGMARNLARISRGIENPLPRRPISLKKIREALDPCRIEG